MRLSIVLTMIALVGSGCVSGYVENQVADLNDQVGAIGDNQTEVVDNRSSKPSYEKLSRGRQKLGESMFNPPAIELLKIAASRDGSSVMPRLISVDTLNIYRDYSFRTFGGGYGSPESGNTTVIMDGSIPKSNYIIIEFSGSVDSSKAQENIVVAYDEGYTSSGFWSSAGFQEAVLLGTETLAKQLLSLE